MSRIFIAIRGKEHFLDVLKEDYEVTFADSCETTFPSKKGSTQPNRVLIKSVSKPRNVLQILHKNIVLKGDISYRKNWNTEPREKADAINSALHKKKQIPLIVKQLILSAHTDCSNVYFKV